MLISIKYPKLSGTNLSDFIDGRFDSKVIMVANPTAYQKSAVKLH